MHRPPRVLHRLRSSRRPITHADRHWSAPLLVAFAFGLFALERSTGSSVERGPHRGGEHVRDDRARLPVQLPFPTRPLSSIGVFSNPWVWVGSATMVVPNSLVTYLPALKRCSGRPPSASCWLRIAAAAAITFAIVSIESAVRRGRAKPPQSQPRAGEAHAHTRRSR